MKVELHDLVKIITNRTKQLMKILLTMVNNTSDDEQACKIRGIQTKAFV